MHDDDSIALPDLDFDGLEVMSVREAAAALETGTTSGSSSCTSVSCVPALHVAALTKSYGTRQVLRDITFSVAAGDVVALLGPNGAGKTSVVEILEGHRRRDSGTVSVLGLDPGDPRDFRGLRGRIGVVLQQTMLEPGLTVRELLTRQASYYRRGRSPQAMIEELELSSHADSAVRALSGGLRRRLDIALALIGRPEVLFLDEPTTGLDPMSRRNIRTLVRRVQAEGTTVLLTSHDLQEVQDLADRVHVLDDGVIVSAGSPADLISASGTHTVVEFRLTGGDPTTLPAGAVVLGRTVRYEVTHQDELLLQLHAWAREHGVGLDHLSITPPTLEDAYAALISTTTGGR